MFHRIPLQRSTHTRFAAFCGAQIAQQSSNYTEIAYMLVRFDSKVGMLTMFGEVAQKLLRMMGQSGSIPGAMLAQDIPTAVQRLRQGVGMEPRKAADGKADDEEPQVDLSQRAFPLIELLERAAKSGADVIWEQEGKAI